MTKRKTSTKPAEITDNDLDKVHGGAIDALRVINEVSRNGVKADSGDILSSDTDEGGGPHVKVFDGT